MTRGANGNGRVLGTRPNEQFAWTWDEPASTDASGFAAEPILLAEAVRQNRQPALNADALVRFLDTGDTRELTAEFAHLRLEELATSRTPSFWSRFSRAVTESVATGWSVLAMLSLTTATVLSILAWGAHVEWLQREAAIAIVASVITVFMTGVFYQWLPGRRPPLALRPPRAPAAQLKSAIQDGRWLWRNLARAVAAKNRYGDTLIRHATTRQRHDITQEKLARRLGKLRRSNELAGINHTRALGDEQLLAREKLARRINKIQRKEELAQVNHAKAVGDAKLRVQATEFHEAVKNAAADEVRRVRKEAEWQIKEAYAARDKEVCRVRTESQDAIQRAVYRSAEEAAVFKKSLDEANARVIELEQQSAAAEARAIEQQRAQAEKRIRTERENLQRRIQHLERSLSDERQSRQRLASELAELVHKADERRTNEESIKYAAQLEEIELQRKLLLTMKRRTASSKLARQRRTRRQQLERERYREEVAQIRAKATRHRVQAKRNRARALSPEEQFAVEAREKFQRTANKQRVYDDVKRQVDQRMAEAAKEYGEGSETYKDREGVFGQLLADLRDEVSQ